MITKFLETVSIWAIPFFLAAISLYGIFRKVKRLRRKRDDC